MPAADRATTARPLYKSQLSRPRQVLLKLMSRLNHGKIENLVIQDGEPVYSPAPTLTRSIKFSAPSDSRPETWAGDYPLKSATVELFDRMDQGRNFTVQLLEVQGGLPYRMHVEEPLR